MEKHTKIEITYRAILHNGTEFKAGTVLAIGTDVTKADAQSLVGMERAVYYSGDVPAGKNTGRFAKLEAERVEKKKALKKVGKEKAE